MESNLPLKIELEKLFVVSVTLSARILGIDVQEFFSLTCTYEKLTKDLCYEILNYKSYVKSWDFLWKAKLFSDVLHNDKRDKDKPSYQYTDKLKKRSAVFKHNSGFES